MTQDAGSEAEHNVSSRRSPASVTQMGSTIVGASLVFDRSLENAIFQEMRWYHGGGDLAESVLGYNPSMNPTSSTPETTPLVDERLRKAAIAAALAAKAASATANANVAGSAADAAVSQGASPGEAASIAVTLERIMREAGPDAVTSDPTLTEASLAAAADGAEAQAISLASGAPAAEDQGQPAVGETRLLAALRELSSAREWVPLSALATQFDVPHAAIEQALYMMRKEDFVRVENDHFFVTESGRRYLEYHSLTKT